MVGCSARGQSVGSNPLLYGSSTQSTSPRPIRVIHLLFSFSQGLQCSFPFRGTYPVTITDSSRHSKTSEVFQLQYHDYLCMVYLHQFQRSVHNMHRDFNLKMQEWSNLRAIKKLATLQNFIWSRKSPWWRKPAFISLQSVDRLTHLKLT